MTTQEILQGVHDWTLQKVVYDISAAHLDGQGNPTPYAGLAAALGTGGANIPEGLRKGGMSIKFIQGSAQSSDNKYVQYRLMSDTFNTTKANWQGVDDVPTAGSENLVKSSGIYSQSINELIALTTPLKLSYTTGQINTYQPFKVKKGDVIVYSLFWDAVSYLIALDNSPVLTENVTYLVFAKSATAMTKGILTIPNDGYIFMRSLSNSPELPFASYISHNDEKPIFGSKKIVTSNGAYIGDIPGVTKNNNIMKTIPVRVGSFDAQGVDTEINSILCTPWFEVIDGVIDIHLLIYNKDKYEGSYIVADDDFANITTIAITRVYQQIQTNKKYVRIRLYKKTGATGAISINDMYITTGKQAEEKCLEYATDNITLVWERGITPDNGTTNQDEQYFPNVRTGYVFVKAGTYKLAINDIHNQRVNVIKSLTGIPNNADGISIGKYTENTLIQITEDCYLRFGTSGPTICCNVADFQNGVKLYAQYNGDEKTPLFTPIAISFTEGYTINPKGSLIPWENIKVSNWMHGAGVYKLVNKNINQAYNICFSPDGNETQNNYCYVTAKNQYIHVPTNMPYWRISMYSSYNWEFYKVKELNGVANVKEFGAVGDGNTDDTAAIQDAINCVAYGDGGEIFLPSGMYMLSTLQTFDNVTANLIIPQIKQGTMSVDTYNTTLVYSKGNRVKVDNAIYESNEDGVTGTFDDTKWTHIKGTWTKRRVNLKGERGFCYTNFNDVYERNGVSKINDLGTLLVSNSDCNINDGGNEPVSVIAVGYSQGSSFNFTYSITLGIKSIGIRTNSLDGYSKLCGLNLGHVAIAFVEDVTVRCLESAIESYDATTGKGYLQESGHVSCGIIMPNVFCDPTTYIRNCMVTSGFTIGVLLGDCQDVDLCFVGLCKYGYVYGEAGHPTILKHNFCFNSNIVIATVNSVIGDYIGENANTWMINTNYVVGDIVLHAKFYYKCTTAHTSTNEFDSTKWEVIYLFGFFRGGRAPIFVDIMSTEMAVSPSAYNTQYLVYDVLNQLKGKVNYYDGNGHTIEPIKSGGENVVVTNLRE